MEHNYVKALSVFNTANLVYAQQCFHEPSMLPGVYMTQLPDQIVCVPDKGWIVWHAAIDAVYEVMTDDEFRQVFTPYDLLPPPMKKICDAHLSFDEWLKTFG